ncbi:lasso RiPP family leader peptide-containing protein [Streptomyces sp. NPDC018019]
MQDYQEVTEYEAPEIAEAGSFNELTLGPHGGLDDFWSGGYDHAW